jgi:hypothetical protein
VSLALERDEGWREKAEGLEQEEEGVLDNSQAFSIALHTSS